MSQYRRPQFWYIMTILIVAAAAILRLIILHDLGNRVAFLTFYPAVIFSALFGGLWAGLLATALSTILADYFIISPQMSFIIARLVDLISILIFIFSATIISYIIEELKQTQSKLLRSEEQFHTMVDAIPQLAWISHPDGSIYWYNRRLYEYTGTTPEQMEGWGWQSVVDPETFHRILERLKKSIATGEDFEMEFPIRGSDGIYRPFLTRAIALKDSKGNILKWFGTNTNVSELKKAEELVRQSEQRFRALVTTGSIVVYRMNPDWSELRQLRGGDILSDTGEPNRNWLNDYVLPEDRQHVLYVIKESIRTKTIFEMEVRVVRQDGTVGWTLSRAVPLFDSKGDIYEWFGAASDITGRKRMEAELQLRSDKLVAANKELESFSYSVSHDLRAPLLTVKGFAELLLEDYSSILDETGKDYLKLIVKGTNKMSELIGDILSLSKITRQEINYQDVDITSLSDEIISELKQSFPDRKISICIEKNLHAQADRNLLKLALQNLIRNAWKFTGKTENPKITVGSFEKDGRQVFFVKDNGAGFDSKHAGGLFEPFRRLHPESEFPGTGIGLAIVDRVIQRHNGKIWVESEVGKGASFFFVLG